jgi:hypothetical protein
VKIVAPNQQLFPRVTDNYWRGPHFGPNAAGSDARTRLEEVMDYTLEAARRLAEELRAIPEKDPSQRRLDKQGMVRELAEELIALKKRGYTMEEIADSLRGRGLDITTPTLKNYLQRAKGGGRKSKKARRPAGPARAGAKAGQATPASSVPPVAERAPHEPDPEPSATASRTEAPASPAPEPGLRSGKGAFLITDKDSY